MGGKVSMQVAWNWLLSFMVNWPKAWKSRSLTQRVISAMRAGTSASARNCKAGGLSVSRAEPRGLASKRPGSHPPSRPRPHPEQGAGLHAGLHARRAARRLLLGAHLWRGREVCATPTAPGAAEALPPPAWPSSSPRG